MKKEELRYLQRLAELYPTIGKASTEIINLQSILNLPKGTEHFMSDLQINDLSRSLSDRRIEFY